MLPHIGPHLQLPPHPHCPFSFDISLLPTIALFPAALIWHFVEIQAWHLAPSSPLRRCSRPPRRLLSYSILHQESLLRRPPIVPPRPPTGPSAKSQARRCLYFTRETHPGDPLQRVSEGFRGYGPPETASPALSTPLLPAFRHPSRLHTPKIRRRGRQIMSPSPAPGPSERLPGTHRRRRRPQIWKRR